MGLFSAKCPVSTEAQQWIDASMTWFCGQFGTDAARRRVVEPSPAYFPDPYAGTDVEIRRVLDRVCGFMGVDSARVRLELLSSDDEEVLRHLPSHATSSSGAAAEYVRDGDNSIITISRRTATDPTHVVAAIAHELGHARLLGEDRVDRARKDQEQLTDLVTVFLGMGIFTANAAFDFAAHQDGRRSGWSAQRLGYLSEQMFGYALAVWARLRDEEDPDWARHLDTNPRAYMKQAMRWLAR
jgi:hypothetical protein